MSKDIYKWWSRKKLKGEILKLKLTYNELFDDMLKTQEENNKLKKAYNMCDEANNDIKEKIKALRKELNERSYVTLEEELCEAKEHIRTLISCLIDWVQEGDKDYYHITEAEQFLKEREK